MKLFSQYFTKDNRDDSVFPEEETAVYELIEGALDEFVQASAKADSAESRGAAQQSYLWSFRSVNVRANDTNIGTSWCSKARRAEMIRVSNKVLRRSGDSKARRELWSSLWNQDFHGHYPALDLHRLQTFLFFDRAARHISAQSAKQDLASLPHIDQQPSALIKDLEARARGKRAVHLKELCEIEKARIACATASLYFHALREYGRIVGRSPSTVELIASGLERGLLDWKRDGELIAHCLSEATYGSPQEVSEAANRLTRAADYARPQAKKPKVEFSPVRQFLNQWWTCRNPNGVSSATSATVRAGTIGARKAFWNCVICNQRAW